MGIAGGQACSELGSFTHLDGEKIPGLLVGRPALNWVPLPIWMGRRSRDCWWAGLLLTGFLYPFRWGEDPVIAGGQACSELGSFTHLDGERNPVQSRIFSPSKWVKEPS